MGVYSVKVSCICPTYGRPPERLHLLEEAVESFLRQGYEDKELIVLNDAAEQELIYNGSGNVRVINEQTRAPTLGDKYNWMVELATGEAICPWEDDDISLPWRISLSVECLGKADYFNPRRYWFMDRKGLHNEHGMGVSHNCSIFRKSAWRAVGGYPASTGNQDRKMDYMLQQATDTVERDWLTVEEWFYIYRWGVSDLHLSGRKPYQETYEGYKQGTMTPGKFEIHPHWCEDYAAMCYEMINDK